VAKRHVLRGVESGSAVAELGAYCSFVDEHGNALLWLQRIDSIGVNGVHAVVVASVFVRVQMVRIQRTYDLLITRHSLSATENGKKTVCPVFFSRSGEVIVLPGEFPKRSHTHHGCGVLHKLPSLPSVASWIACAGL